MEFSDVIEARHSIRAYTGQPIEPAEVQEILETINRAPSAGNLQAFQVYMVCDEGRKAALVRAADGQDFLGQAPLVLVFCARPAWNIERYGQRGASLYCIQDATIACTFAMLAATALGLSTVWVGAFDEHQVADIIGASDGDRPIAMLPIGHGAGEPRYRPRRGLQELVHRLP